MIVERVSIRVKPGCRDMVVDVLKAERAKMDDPSTMRILTPNTGAPSWHTVVYELTSESLAESERSWDEWAARPETPEFMENWFQLVYDWSSEYWSIKE